MAQLYALILRRRDVSRVAELLEAHERRLAELHCPVSATRREPAGQE